MNYSTKYITKEDINCIVNTISDKFYLFGSGLDAERCFWKIDHLCQIQGFVDNYRAGNSLCDLDIISVERWKKIRNKSVLIIASYRYANEIEKQISGLGFVSGNDYFIWDDLFVFHKNKDIIDYIAFNKNLFQDRRVDAVYDTILIPFHNRMDMFPTSLGYFANYFAEKYHAKIKGFSRNGIAIENASNSMLDIYKSVNMMELIDASLNDQQKKYSEDLFEEIWGQIETWEDLRNISIEGVEVGLAFLRYYLRFFLPDLSLKCTELERCLKKCIADFVFWNEYLKTESVKVLILGDAVCWEGILLNIAIHNNIPVYAVEHTGMFKPFMNYYYGKPYMYFDKFWDELSLNEKEYGISWAKQRIGERLSGNTQDVLLPNRRGFTFAIGKRERVLEENDKFKVLICPHIFEEDSYQTGQQIFDDNYLSWLIHLGELSEKIDGYDWYIKMHPAAVRRDNMIIDKLLKKYKKIKKLPADISPYQLKEEGIKVALTVSGSIGHEYPLIGIQVINAGINPHSCFDFTWNPKSKEDYDYLILNLPKLKKTIDKEQVFKFYCLEYLFYDWNPFPYSEFFFNDSELGMFYLDLEAIGKSPGTWMYRQYINQWTEEKHEQIIREIPKLIERMDAWQPDQFYRRKREAE